LQTVPAGVVYWMAVEATRRKLEEQFDIVSTSRSGAIGSSNGSCCRSGAGVGLVPEEAHGGGGAAMVLAV